MSEILRIEELSAGFGRHTAVHNVTLSLPQHASRGLIGETGSGKTTLLLAALGLLPIYGGRITAGHASFRDERLTTLAPNRLRQLWRTDIGFCAQGVESMFDPLRSVGAFVDERLSLRTLSTTRNAESRRAFFDLLEELGGADLSTRLDVPPQVLSSSMLQLIGAALALHADPLLCVLDDPFAGSDSLSQSPVVEALSRRTREQRTTLWFSSSDCGLALSIADYIDVLCDGQIVESAPAAELENTPRHPFTLGLFESALASSGSQDGEQRLPVIAAASAVPATVEFANQVGCRYRPRCALYQELSEVRRRCEIEAPSAREVTPGHVSRCHFAEDVLG